MFEVLPTSRIFKGRSDVEGVLLGGVAMGRLLGACTGVGSRARHFSPLYRLFRVVEAGHRRVEPRFAAVFSHHHAVALVLALPRRRMGVVLHVRTLVEDALRRLLVVVCPCELHCSAHGLPRLER